MKTFSDLGTFLLGNLCNGYRGFNAILILQEYTGMSFMIICMYILLFKIIFKLYTNKGQCDTLLCITAPRLSPAEDTWAQKHHLLPRATH